jgi:hypothetical protein
MKLFVRFQGSTIPPGLVQLALGPNGLCPAGWLLAQHRNMIPFRFHRLLFKVKVMAGRSFNPTSTTRRYDARFFKKAFESAQMKFTQLIALAIVFLASLALADGMY